MIQPTGYCILVYGRIGTKFVPLHIVKSFATEQSAKLAARELSTIGTRYKILPIYTRQFLTHERRGIEIEKKKIRLKEQREKNKEDKIKAKLDHKEELREKWRIHCAKQLRD